MVDKKKVEYTKEQKDAVLKRVKELGNLKKAAEEAGVSWQLVSMWRKEADPSATRAAQAAKKRAEASGKGKKSGRDSRSKNVSRKTESRSKTEAKSAGKTNAKTSGKTNSKKLKSLEVNVKKDVPASRLQIENAVLKTENSELKKQVARLQKAVRELM